MTNWYQIFYWLTVADGVKSTLDVFSNWFLFFSIISGIVMIFLIFLSFDPSIQKVESDEKAVLYWKRIFVRVFSWCFTITFISWTLWAMVPTKKDALIIIAGGAVGNFVTQDSSARKIPAEVMQLLRTKIQEEINNTSVKDIVNEDRLEQKSKEELIQIIKNQDETSKTP